MRRAICYCEPAEAVAGETNTWQFVYTTPNTLPKGTILKFDLMSKGRPIDWEIPTANLRKGQNTIYAIMDNDKIVNAQKIESRETFVPYYEFVLPRDLPAKGTFTILVGAPPTGVNAKKYGTRTQCTAQRRRSFLLYVDPTGKRKYGEPEVFSMDIRGASLNSIRLLTPAFVSKNKRFDVVVRFEDEFGNLTNNAPPNTMVELSHENLRENLRWKLFVSETGFVTLPNLYFNEPGVYTIQLKNTLTKQLYRSAPIKCFAETEQHLFWGILHGESERIDSTENIESCLRHIRDEKALNYFAVSPFENSEETSNEVWKLVAQNVSDFDENDRFTTYLGFQWVGVPKEEGVRHIIFLKDNKQLPRKKDPKNNTLKKIYKNFSPKEILSIPTFTMGKGYEYNFADFAPQYERVVEIYNSWGSSECPKKEENPCPMACESKGGIVESAEGSIRKALQQNCRFGFVAGGLDDRGIYAELFDSDQVQYPPGLTAIIAKEHSRSALAEALFQRSCYATTGERIIVGFSLASLPMGSEVSTADKPGLMVNRHLSGYVAGTTPLKIVEIIRNGKVLATFDSKHYSLDFAYDDSDSLDKIALSGSGKGPPFVYYYLRVIQEDGHMAWSSPIWVDYVPVSTKVVAKKPQPPKKVVPSFEEEEEEEEEEEKEELYYDDEEEDEEDEE